MANIKVKCNRKRLMSSVFTLIFFIYPNVVKYSGVYSIPGGQLRMQGTVFRKLSIGEACGKKNYNVPRET